MVKLCNRNSDRKPFAVKIINTPKNMYFEDKEKLKEEMILMKSLDHPNIIKF